MWRNVILFFAMSFLALCRFIFISGYFNFNRGLFTYSFLKYNVKNTKNSTVKILFWTKVFKGQIINKIQQQTPVPSWCQMTFDRSQVNESDAIIFHVPWREVKSTDLPKTRRSDQIWVFFTNESPAYMYFDMTEWDLFKFNRTLTYRLDSNFSSPYGLLIPRKKPLLSWKIPRNKTKLAVWMVSNCKTPSKRNSLSKELQKYLNVDIYGKCGKYLCKSSRPKCYEALGKKYKFYFAFENSLCTDYVTEKFFNALKFGMVPIGLSGANYSKFAPTGSYIDASGFKNAKELAQYLKFLDNNDTEYEKYFEWNKYYEIKIRHKLSGFRKLCFAIRYENELTTSFTYENMKKWWKGEHCSHKGLL